MRCKSFEGIFLAALLLAVAGCGPTNGFPALTGEYVYVSNQADGTISEYSIDTSTGLLTNDAIVVQPSSTSGPYPGGAYPAVTGSGLQLMALHATNEFLYVPDSTTDDIATAYPADGTQSGELFPLGFPATSTGTSPFEVGLDPSGNYLYATDANEISEYSIDLHNGLLSSIGTVSTTPEIQRGLASANFGGFPIVAVVQGAPPPHGPTYYPGIQLFGLYPNGTLFFFNDLILPIPPDEIVTAGSTPELVVFNPKNNLQVFVTDDGLGVVWIFGFFPRMVGYFIVNSQTSISAGGYPFGLTTDPAGNYLYTANPKSNSISIFPITSSGLSTPTVFTGPPPNSGVQSTLDCPISIAIEPMGEYAYVANNCNGTVSEFSVDSSTGALSPIGVINTENPANPSSQPFSILTTH
jgi:6-phosphogluconolactonase (cycloisomerase 2 family)